MLWVGLDEAGYGPTLGPLVIACTVWRVPDNTPVDSLEALFRRVIVADHPTASYRQYDDWLQKQHAAGKQPSPASWQKKTPPLWITDSKKIHQPGNLARLERAVLPVLQLATSRCRSTNELRNFWSTESLACACQAWEWQHERSLPYELQQRQLPPPEFYRAALERLGIRLLQISARVIFPGEFNHLLELHQNKSTLLSHSGLQLLANCLQTVETNQQVVIVADKHGGRDRYGELLQRFWPTPLITTHGESRSASHYRWTDNGSEYAITFRTNGEEAIPTAAASLTAKYIRELSMQQLNRYFRQLQSGLQPTAGYPVDAQRFLSETETSRTAQAIADELLIRRK